MGVYKPTLCCQLGCRAIFFRSDQDVLPIDSPFALASLLGGFPRDLDHEDLVETEFESIEFLAFGFHICPRILFLFSNLRELITVGNHETRDNMLEAWKLYPKWISNFLAFKVPILVMQSEKGFEAMMERAITLSPISHGMEMKNILDRPCAGSAVDSFTNVCSSAKVLLPYFRTS